MAIQLQVKRGVEANRPALADGEFYYSTDSKRVFIGSTPSGLPVRAASVNLSAQGAAISATPLLTPSTTGFYRISAYLKVTRAATTSSTMGAVTITFTDGVDSVAQSLVLGLMTQAGAVATTNTGNATTSKLCGTAVIYAKAGVAIQYAVAYTTSGTTSMQYELNLSCEAL